MKRWCTTHSVQWRLYDPHQDRSCERRIIARRRTEPGWRAAVLDERASRHAFRLRVSEEGSGSRAPASASGASNVDRSEQRRSFLWERLRWRRIPSAMGEQLKIKVTAMVTAIVFVKAEVARIPEVAEEIAALRGVSEVYSVTGTIDLIVMIRVSDHDQVADVVADQLNKVPGVVSTETHIAFR